MSLEAHRCFACFGGTATVHVRTKDSQSSEVSADRAASHLLEAHRRLSRFLPDSELTHLNADQREVVPASPLMLRVADAVATAGQRSGGLVDATLIGDLERAGYRDSMEEHGSVSLADALSRSPRRSPAGANPNRRWRSVLADQIAGSVSRPPGLRIDSGGIAKGLLADLLAATLQEHSSYAVDCCGDIRIGGTAQQPRTVLVDDPFGGQPVHEFKLPAGAVATSGIGRRCWIDPDGRVAHHILDPSNGKPAFTGIVQASAIAPTALLAETLAKAALLSGPDRAAAWLPHGGVLIRDSGEVELVDAERPLPRALLAQ